MSNNPEEPAPAIWQDIEQAATPFLPQTAVGVEEAIQAYGDAERALYDFSDRDAIRKRDVARNELRAAIAAQPAPDATPALTWQDIDTAPNDATLVDLWVRPHDAFANGNANRIPDAHFKGGEWWRRLDGAFFKISKCGTPTHWMSHPSAPDATPRRDDPLWHIKAARRSVIEDIAAERDRIQEAAEAVVNRWAGGEPLDAEMRELMAAIGWEAAP